MQRFAIVGPGRVGTALATQLQGPDWHLLGVMGRDDAHSQRAAEKLRPADGSPLLYKWEAIFSRADLVFLATPDDTLPGLAEELAARVEASGEPRANEGPVILHLSGACSSEVLAPLRRVGAAVGSLHPNQSVADGATSLRGIAWGIEGDAEAVQTARAIVEYLGGKPLFVHAAAKPLYHAAACVASNYVTVLAALAAELLIAAGVQGEATSSALLPLMQGALDNLRRVGLPGALTGPIERGDAETIKAHLNAFRTHGVRSDLEGVYRALGCEALRLAQEKGSLQPKGIAELQKLLGCARTSNGTETGKTDGR